MREGADHRRSRGRTLAVLLPLLGSVPPLDAAESPSRGAPLVRHSIRHDTSPPLRRIARLGGPSVGPIPARPPLRREPPARISGEAGSEVVAEGSGGPSARGAVAPAPTASFDGVVNEDNVTVGEGLGVPPDTVGDVGPAHYVQMTNVVFEVFTKDGESLLGPARNSSIWSGFGGLCQSTNQGDPIVLFDPLVDNPSGPDGRWVLSQFAFNLDVQGDPVAPFRQCVAVSTTGNPTGSYHRYDFHWSNTEFNDYPKLGVWHDAYYLSVNEFTAAGFDSAAVAALERDRMLSGLSATLVEFDLDDGVAPDSPNSFTLLPSDVDGTTPPPAGAPNYFVELRDPRFFSAPPGLNVWKFHVDFATPASSTLTGPVILQTTAYNPVICPQEDECVDQPGTNQKLDPLSDRLMHRNAYRNFGTHESLVLTHSVKVGMGTSVRPAIRWYEVRNPGLSPPTLFQQGTHSPDGDGRWMGSIAMDGDGNIAAGYSVSSSSTSPAIRYAGRLAGDPVGMLSQGETTLQAGGGSQTHASGRWGDYSAMTVDPVDDCTFWYTNEYYSSTSQLQWRTRIGSFRFPSCGEPPSASISIGDAATVLEGDAGTTPVTFPVTLSQPAAQEVTVQFVTADGTATAPDDYQAASGTVTFAPSDTSESVTVSVNGDMVPEPDETFSVDLLAPSSNATIADGHAEGSITDDDGPPPALSIDDVSLAEGDGGESPAIFTVSLSPAVDQPVTVEFETADGSAMAPADYQQASGTVAFDANDVSETLTVDVNGDFFVEGNELFLVRLADPINAVIADEEGVGMIVDDEPAATCLGRAASMVGTGGSDVMIGTPANDVVVALGGSDEVRTAGGRDRVCAGGGDDAVRTGSGSDKVAGQSGRDLLLGGGGRDALRGGSSPDVLRGHGGDDDLFGNGGNDRLRGGPGRDRCRGGSGADVLVGCEA